MKRSSCECANLRDSRNYEKKRRDFSLFSSFPQREFRENVICPSTRREFVETRFGNNDGSRKKAAVMISELFST